MSSKINPAHTTSSLQLKGGLYTLTALQLLNTQLTLLTQQLDHKIQQAPKFFHNAPIVIDLQKIGSQTPDLDFKQLKDILLARHLVPVGVKGGTTQQHADAIAAGLAVLPDNGREETDQKVNEHSESYSRSETAEKSNAGTLPYPKGSELGSGRGTGAEPDIQGSNTRLITEPVRSGQQIYARGGDLVVLAPVSHGSELLADGHIHVYGPLRGRALAGVTGDLSARIFCQSLEAELISIAGQYKISEDIEPSAWCAAANIYLNEGHLQISAI